MRVLVADDDRLSAEILSRTLKRWHYEVTRVQVGSRAEITPADDTIEITLRRADAALYETKRGGRDRAIALPANDASVFAGAA